MMVEGNRMLANKNPHFYCYKNIFIKNLNLSILNHILFQLNSFSFPFPYFHSYFVYISYRSSFPSFSHSIIHIYHFLFGFLYLFPHIASRHLGGLAMYKKWREGEVGDKKFEIYRNRQNKDYTQFIPADRKHQNWLNQICGKSTTRRWQQCRNTRFPFAFCPLFPFQILLLHLLFYKIQLMFKQLVTLATLIFVLNSSCHSTSLLPHLDAGLANLVLNNNAQISTSQFSRSFSTSFQRAPMIALTIHDFIIANYQVKHWALYASSVTKGSALIQFDHERNRWTSLKIGFWASDRSDLIVGHGPSQLGQISGGSKVVKYSLARPLQNPSRSIVRTFLNGLILNSASSISVGLLQKSLSKDSFEAIVNVGSSMQAKTVYLSYLAFNPNEAGFVSYGAGFSEKSFASTKIYDLHKNVYSSQYYFYGFIQMELGGSSPFGFTSSFDNEFFLKISTNREFDAFTLSYIVIGVSPSKICADCTSKYIYQNSCVDQCPSTTYKFVYRDQGMGCRSCPTRFNFVLNDQGTGCVCKSGFSQTNGICQLSSSGSSEAQQQQTQQTTNFGSNSNSFIPSANNNNQNGQFVPSGTVNPSSGSQVKVEQESQDDPRPEYVSRDCSHIQNAYWTGYRCACRVGYDSVNGICVPSTIHTKTDVFRPAEFIYKISRLYTKVQCSLANEHYDGKKCVCNKGFYRSNEGVCQQVKECPSNSIFLNGNCVCNPGYTQQDGFCIKACPDFSYDNGFGECVCIQNYYKTSNGYCAPGNPCPAYSTRDATGKCVCNPGYIDFGGICSRCSQGKIWSQTDGRCIMPCGINEILDLRSGECECKSGYGKYKGKCDVCPPSFLVKEGYCVSCPLNSVFNEATSKCDCEPGLSMNLQGFCESQCKGQRQIYDQVAKKCKCIGDYGYLNGQCTVCQLGVDPTTHECRRSCSSNQIMRNSACVCIDGFGFNQRKECVDCSTLGGFLIDGFCAYCPSTFVYNGRICSCPTGTSQRNGICAASCKNGQILDHNGVCYWCPVNEIAVNGRCQCKEGFEKVSGRCEAKCKPNQVVIGGICATCAIGTVYDVNLQACVCPEGYYKNNYGICTPSIITPVTCDPGFYYTSDNGCVSCPFGCLECESANVCTKCPQFYEPSGSQCKPLCGDGYAIPGIEECDDKNKANYDGCSNCKVENGWKCYGNNPSFCEVKNVGPRCGDGLINNNENCDDKNVNSGDGCSATCLQEEGWSCVGSPSTCTKDPVAPQTKGMKLSNIVTNYANVFIMLETEKVYTFTNENQMKKFMQYDFPDASTTPASAYCVQNVGQKKLFQCLLLYPSGVPNYEFNVNFSYNYKGDEGSLQVKVDPLANPFASRSLL